MRGAIAFPDLQTASGGLRRVHTAASHPVMSEEPTDSPLADETLAATDDLRVAAVAAVCTVALTLGLRYGLGREIAALPRLLPLGPYFLSLFTSRLDLGGLDTPRNWSLVTVAVTLAAFGYFGVFA
jgi:hypothetical protein